MTPSTGLKGIQKLIGVRSPRIVLTYARRRRDPLPLWRLGRSVTYFEQHVRDWDARRRDRRARGALGPALPVLVGWDAIAEGMPIGASLDAVQAWAKDKRDPLPVEGLNEPAQRIGGSVWIYASAHRDWCQRHLRPYQHASGETKTVTMRERARNQGRNFARGETRAA